MRGMLNAVDNNEAIRGNSADGFGNGGNIHPHARDRRGMKDGGNSNIGCDLGGILIGGDQAGGIVMCDADIFHARNLGPSAGGASGGRVLDG